jgi:hypothetical protein
MPKSTTKAKQAELITGTSRSKRKTRTRMLFVIPAAILVILGLALLSRWNSGLADQSKMKQYLDNKYNAKFIVEDPKREGSGFGVEGYLESLAYPSNNTGIRFPVRISSTNIWDGYPSAVWISQERKEIHSLIQRLFENKKTNFTLDIGSYDIEQTIHGDIPSFESITNKYRDTLSYSLAINISSSLSMKSIAKQISPLIGHIISRHVRATLRITYIGSEIKLDNEAMNYIAHKARNITQYIRTTSAE